jgi:SAM-dependent methyltransferase
MALPTLIACRICEGAIARSMVVQEMMFGSRTEFLYRQCAACDCLQIDTFPPDIARHYPSGYYSFNLAPAGALKRWRRGLRRKWVLTASTAAANLLRYFSRADDMFRVYRDLGVGLKSRVLDVGAGAGSHVLEMRDAGVTAAVGVDAFVPEDISWRGEILVRKGTLDGLAGKFDLVTFHHSFEHMPDQIRTLALARGLLAPGGRILVRVPTVTSEAFDIYQDHWVQLDAPRHFYLHSHRSIEIAASKAGLAVSALWCDSSELQFMASEQYRRGISLFDPLSVVVNKRSTLFSAEEKAAFGARTRELNRTLRGDQINVVLRAA